MTAHPDILVVGLGPAGAAAAKAAAIAGFRVLAIDRRRRAGEPVQCAEFVPRMLGADHRAVSLAGIQPITRMETYLENLGVEVTPDFQGVMIDRAAFDTALVAEAEAAGAEVRFGTLLRSLDAEGALLGDGTRITPKLIIGADGPRSPVGAASGIRNRELCETRQITVPLNTPHEATDIFLNAEIEGGYAWLFPRGEVANLGLGLRPEAKALLKPVLERLHDQLADAGRVGREVLRTTGGAIPVGGIVGPVGSLAEIPVLLAGDAAGLTNPVTGAGISAAVVSGELAATAAADWLKGKTDALDDYAEEIDDLFGGSLRLGLARRRALLETYCGGNRPDAADLRAGWIAYPEYWTRTATEAVETRLGRHEP